MTPEECALEWESMVNAMTSNVGEIRSTFGDVPAYGLALDGGTYHGADYPALYNSLPAQFKGSGDLFTLPDMTGQFLAGGVPTGATGGEASHTLSIDELPIHSHTTHAHIPGGLGGEVPAVAAGPETPGTTGTVGLGLAHENRPPFVTARFYVVAL